MKLVWNYSLTEASKSRFMLCVKLYIDDRMIIYACVSIEIIYSEIDSTSSVHVRFELLQRTLPYSYIDITKWVLSVTSLSLSSFLPLFYFQFNSVEVRGKHLYRRFTLWFLCMLAWLLSVCSFTESTVHLLSLFYFVH